MYSIGVASIEWSRVHTKDLENLMNGFIKTGFSAEQYLLFWEVTSSEMKLSFSTKQNKYEIPP